MAVKHIIARGIGFADGGDNLKYIPTHGLTPGVGAVLPTVGPGEKIEPPVRSRIEPSKRATITWPPR